MRLFIPSTSRSDEPNTLALKSVAESRGHELVERPGGAQSAIILGDRHEMLQVAHDCIVSHVPYVHVGAGCVTRGSWDQRFRDMLTSGASQFWPYTRAAFDEVDSLYGCDEGYGVPVLDTLAPLGLTRLPFVLVAINPVTEGNVGEEIDLVDEIAEACRSLGKPVMWSSPNEDPRGEHLIYKLSDTWPLRRLLCSFHTALASCSVIVGNSSAALIEAPAMWTPFVDCGCRQDGRPLAQGLRGIELYNAIARSIPHTGEHPYRHPERKASQSIIELAEEVANG